MATLECELDNQTKNLSVGDVSLLPLTHLTDFGTLVSIIEDGCLKSLKDCKIYKQKLIFTFYGRAAYRFSDDEVSHSSISFTPVCIVFSPSSLENACRIVAFDTGGIGRYKEFLHPSLDHTSFELSKDTISSCKMIKFFWGENNNYMKCKISKDLKFPATSICLENYYALASDDGDQRKSTIEIQFESPLKIGGAISAIILSQDGVDDVVLKFANTHNISVLTYDHMAPYYKNDFAAYIKVILNQFIKSGKY